MEIYPDDCRDLTTPMTDTTKLFLAVETAPYAQSGKDLVIGGGDAFGCIEIAASDMKDGDAKTVLGKKLVLGKTWKISIDNSNSHHYIYVVGGKRHPAGGKATLIGTVTSAGDAGIGTGTGVVMEQSAVVATAAGGTVAVAGLASLGAVVVIVAGVLAYYAYKRSSSRTVYFIRIGRRPYLNSGEKGRFMYRCAARGDYSAFSLANAALSHYSGWDDVKEIMKKEW